MILALFRKAVATGKVAVMGNVQTERFYYGLTFLEIHDVIFVFIFGKQLSVFCQLFYFLITLWDQLFRIFIFQFCLDRRKILLFIQCNNIIGRIVHNMNRSAVYIKDNIITIIFVLVDQILFLTFLYFSLNAQMTVCIPYGPFVFALFNCYAITLFAVFAALVSYCAGCFTCRLAGCLALTAAAFFYCIL